MTDNGERNAIAQRHASYYREFLERIKITSLTCSKNDSTAERWRHVSNARAALEWSFSEQGDTELGTALAAASAPVFLELSLLTECRVWMERAIAEHGGQGDRREMELQEALAVSLMFIKGKSDDVLAAVTTTLSLAQFLNLSYDQMRLLAAHHTFLVRIGDFRGAATVAEKNEAVAKRAADPMAVMMADWMLGVSHHLLGDQASARKYCETALNTEPINNSSLIRPGYDQRIRALLTSARALWLGGYANRALTVATQALHQATALDHPVSLCLCGIYKVTLFLWRGEWSESESIIDKLISCADKYSLRCHHAICLGLKGELALGRAIRKLACGY